MVDGGLVAWWLWLWLVAIAVRLEWVECRISTSEVDEAWWGDGSVGSGKAEDEDEDENVGLRP